MGSFPIAFLAVVWRESWALSKCHWAASENRKIVGACFHLWRGAKGKKCTRVLTCAHLLLLMGAAWGQASGLCVHWCCGAQGAELCWQLVPAWLGIGEGRAYGCRARQLECSPAWLSLRSTITNTGWVFLENYSSKCQKSWSKESVFRQIFGDT